MLYRIRINRVNGNNVNFIEKNSIGWNYFRQFSTWIGFLIG